MGFVSDDCFISLTVNTVNFCKACLSLSRDLMTMYTSEQESLLTSAMSEIFQEQLNHIRTSLQSPDFNKEVRADNRNKYYKSQLSTKTLIWKWLYILEKVNCIAEINKYILFTIMLCQKYWTIFLADLKYFSMMQFFFLIVVQEYLAF